MSIHEDVTLNGSEDFVVECTCGCNFTLEQFRTLPFIGVNMFGDHPQPSGIEIRECVCGKHKKLKLDKEGNLCKL